MCGFESAVEVLSWKLVPVGAESASRSGCAWMQCALVWGMPENHRGEGERREREKERGRE